MPEVVLPVLNEVNALPWVLERMPAGFRPIVVDNGSDDGSAKLAARLGAEVLHEPRRGFGAACHTGLSATTADVVCFMDCDRSLDPEHLPRVADPVNRGEADLMLGARQASPGAFSLHARWANHVLARSVRRRTGIQLSDLGPMRAGDGGLLRALPIEDRRFGYPLEMVIRAADAGLVVSEVPVPYLPRIGDSKVTGTLSGTARAIRDMRRVLA